ncbi:MAG TPA: sortase [Candidatus Limnocylindrales bacterium]
MEQIRRHRRAISTALALLLAIESVAAVSVAAVSTLTAPHSAAHALPAAAPDGQVLAETGDAARAWEPGATVQIASPAPSPVAPEPFLDPRPYVHPIAPTATPAATKKPAATPKPKTTPKVTTKTPTATKTSTPKPAAVSYTGRNRVWMPSLGVNQSVSFFSCTRSAPPDNYVYRWGCAGSNNVYLLGHAYGVFKPLHDAYLNGKLVAGMRVYYADGSGKVHVYAVRWWKLTLPTADASWAWAAQSVPSMTLQTCMGANSQYRLIVRLVQVG